MVKGTMATMLRSWGRDVGLVLGYQIAQNLDAHTHMRISARTYATRTDMQQCGEMKGRHGTIHKAELQYRMTISNKNNSCRPSYQSKSDSP